MKFHRAGQRTISYFTAIFAALILIIYFFVSDNTIRLAIAGPYAVIYFLIIQFFRVPKRTIVLNENVIISPADGKICEIVETIETEYLKAKCLQVSIFMSPTNVHMNWIPIPGQITYMKHKDGEFYAAFKDKSAEENERTVTALKLKDGREIVIKQIAGAMARRIINYVEVGDKVDQKTELGFIRFGSRVDLYLPLGTKINVKLRDKVVGSQTIIGEI